MGQPHLIRQGIRPVHTLQLAEGFLAAFRALDGFFAVEGAQCADDILLMLDFLLLHFVCLLLHFTIDFLLLPKEGIIPVINR